MARERTFALLKPDAVQRGLVSEVLRRFERKGLKLVAMKLVRVSKDLAESYYAEHKGKPFFRDLVDFITSGPVLALAVSGENAIAGVRTLMGPTHPKDAEPGTIRGDYAILLGENVVHGSDSKASARRELKLFFPGGLL